MCLENYLRIWIVLSLCPQVSVIAIGVMCGMKCSLNSFLVFGLERERSLTSWDLEKAFKSFLVLETLITLRTKNVMFFNIMMSVYSNLKAMLKCTSHVSKHPAFFCDYILLLAKITT